MKSLKMFILVLLFSLLITPPALAKQEVLFEMKDARGDDYGTGTYIYPYHEQFSNHQGLFDLNYFKVIETDDKYIFHFKFNEITNPWQAPYGFSHQLIQVYIDNSAGGSNETFKQGANVKFEKQHPWDQLLKITGWNVQLFTVDDDREEYSTLSSAEVNLENDKLIKVSIPQQKLNDLSRAYYYVLIASLDGFHYDNYRQVTAEGGQWEFGGGRDSDINPNVIDTLVPDGLDQKQLLRSFSLEEGELATLRAVGPELALPWKLIIIFAFSIVFILTILGAVLKIIRNFF
ncbi:MAG: glucodextranase DOMON-like domain-containing protein [Halanaerobacter sp.]